MPRLAKPRRKNFWTESCLIRNNLDSSHKTFQICLIWKLSQGLIQGYDVKWTHDERRGRYAVPNSATGNAPSKVRSAKERSLGVNLLPSHLRNENSGDYDLFKNHLQLFLDCIHNEQTSSGLVQAATSNSLVDQIPLALRGDI